MNKLISFLLIPILLIAAAVPAAAAPAVIATGDAVSYRAEELTAYLYSKDDTVSMSCLFRADLPTVPYIGAVDYLNQLYTVAFTSKKNPDGTFTVSDPNGEMIVDVEKDTVHFDDFETFVESDTRPILEDETAYYLLDEVEFEVLHDFGAVDLDLAAYGIDLTASGDQVYFPLTTINDIFASVYHQALYLDGALCFIDVMEDELYYDDSSLFDSLTRTKMLASFSYRELCFAMDHFYGCPPKAKLADAIREKGFDRALADYDATTAQAREMLQSADLIDYLYGLLYLDEYIDDGGHSMMSYGFQVGLDRHTVSALSKAFTATAGDFTDGRIVQLISYYQGLIDDNNAAKKLRDERERVFASMTAVKEWDEAVFYVVNGVGFFSFDEFKDAVVEPFKWSLDYAVENGIGDFVVDLSLNGGGSTAVNYYFLSMMCGDARMDFSNRLTDSRYSLSATVDRNLDGVFDEADDQVNYDLRFAVMTSDATFSAANALACALKERGIAVIGESSGGGTCAVSVHYDASGFAFVLSDAAMIVDTEGDDLDSGATADVETPGRLSGYQGFYDFETIGAGMRRFYQSGSASSAKTDRPSAVLSTVQVPEVVLWSVPCAVALLHLLIFIVTVIRNHPKKKRI